MEKKYKIFNWCTRDIIAFGTGGYAKFHIPLYKEFGFNLRGMTNSTITSADGGTFLDTKLPIRSAKVWKELYPDATILITTTEIYHKEIAEFCKKLGFTDIVYSSSQLLQNMKVEKIIERLWKRGVSFSGKYLTFGNVTLLNPFKNDQINTREFFSELSDIILPTYYKDWQLFSFSEGPYERGEGELCPGDVAIDCGANIGIFSAYASAKGCTCYAFEPTSAQYSIIEAHNKLNGGNIILVPFALADQEGTSSFYTYDSRPGSNRLTELNHPVKNLAANESETIVNIQKTTIDHFVEERGLKRVDFIKADIEGAERLMLAGAQNTLKEFAPRLAICKYHFPDDKEVLTELILQANPKYQIEYQWGKLFAHVPNSKV